MNNKKKMHNQEHRALINLCLNNNQIIYGKQNSLSCDSQTKAGSTYLASSHRQKFTK